MHSNVPKATVSHEGEVPSTQYRVLSTQYGVLRTEYSVV